MMKKPAFISSLLLIYHIFCGLSAFAQQELRKVTARRGDGIEKILRENGLDPGIYSKQFIDLNSDKIGKNKALFAGEKYLLPGGESVANSSDEELSSNTVTRNYSIFGNKYSKVEIKYNDLEGAVYYLVSGHGGPDPGATARHGNYTLAEDEYAYDVTLRLARNLIEHGALVYMVTRDENDGIRDQAILPVDSDERSYPSEKIPVNQTARLRQRADAVNRLYSKYRGRYQRVVIIHLDSRSRSENIDVFFYYHSGSRSGKKLAGLLQDTFREKYMKYQPGRSYYGSVSARNGLWVIRNTHPPAVFIELGNMRNSRDQQRFLVYDNRQALSNWICEGMIKDYKSR